MQNDIIFSHRPKAGVSVGARKLDDNTLVVAFALTNDGSSSNGIFWKERRDSFNRKTARRIINGRMKNLCDDMVVQLTTDMTARRFMSLFRQTFKPTPDETDDFLNTVFRLSELGDQATDIRYRLPARDIVYRLTHLAESITRSC